ncbi:MAG: flagellar hook-length control protein FliK, partial [Melioribacteraceae bacterium]|nr:flagellar hook-length control protein FliK [Melioribacteraceae bacterium]
ESSNVKTGSVKPEVVSKQVVDQNNVVPKISTNVKENKVEISQADIRKNVIVNAGPEKDITKTKAESSNVKTGSVKPEVVSKQVVDQNNVVPKISTNVKENKVEISQADIRKNVIVNAGPEKDITKTEVESSNVKTGSVKPEAASKQVVDQNNVVPKISTNVKENKVEVNQADIRRNVTVNTEPEKVIVKAEPKLDVEKTLRSVNQKITELNNNAGLVKQESKKADYKVVLETSANNNIQQKDLPKTEKLSDVIVDSSQKTNVDKSQTGASVKQAEVKTEIEVKADARKEVDTNLEKPKADLKEQVKIEKPVSASKEVVNQLKNLESVKVKTDLKQPELIKNNVAAENKNTEQNKEIEINKKLDVIPEKTNVKAGSDEKVIEVKEPVIDKVKTPNVKSTTEVILDNNKVKSVPTPEVNLQNEVVEAAQRESLNVHVKKAVKNISFKGNKAEVKSDSKPSSGNVASVTDEIKSAIKKSSLTGESDNKDSNQKQPQDNFQFADRKAANRFEEMTNIREVVNSERIAFDKIENSADTLKTVKSAEVVKEIAKFIEKQDKTSLVIKVNPEHLGKVKIALEITNKIVRANIEVENVAAKQMLEANIKELNVNLSQSGTQFGGVNITLANADHKNAKHFTNKKKNSSGSDVGDENEASGKGESGKVKDLGYNTVEYLA